MLLALTLAFVALASGWLLTHFYLTRSTLSVRLCAGACTGLALLGAIGFLFASFFGMGSATLVSTAAVTALPLVLLRRAAWRERLLTDVRSVRSFGASGFGILVCAVALVFVFSFAMYERGGAIYTGFDNNLGDLPFHISIITGFAKGENFPPEHTEYAGVRLTYPFLVDFIAALFVRAGASLAAALLIENALLALAFAGMIYLFARELTRDAAAAGLSVVLVLMSGGLGWWMFVADATAGQVFFATLSALPRNYTIASAGGYRWGNALTVLLVPQRGLLLGAPLFLLACTLLWQVVRGAEPEDDSGNGKDSSGGSRAAKATRNNSKRAKRDRKAREREASADAAREVDSTAKAAASVGVDSVVTNVSAEPLALRRMIAAGVIAGLLPLAHAHTFLVLMAAAVALAALFRVAPSWRAWAAFFTTALVLAVPQMIWATRESPVAASDFIAWQFGWDRGTENVLWFWLKNTGVFLPLLFAALVWRVKDKAGGASPLLPRRVLLFYVPFACVFVGANVLRLSPWIWDNVKVFFLWFVASAPLVALLLTRLWREGRAPHRIAVACLTFALVAAGALDVLRVVQGGAEQRI